MGNEVRRFMRRSLGIYRDWRGGGRRLLAGLTTVALAGSAIACSPDATTGSDRDTTAVPSKSPATRTTSNLKGAYSSVIPAEDLKEFNPVTYPPKIFAGEYTFLVKRRSYIVEHAQIGRFSGRLVTRNGVLRFRDVPAPKGVFNCFDDTGERAVKRADAIGVYSYTLDGKRLELQSEEEPCPFRRVLMERSWQVEE